MKKIITLLFAVGAVTSVFAQSDREEARRVVLGSGTKNGGSTSSDGKNVVLGNGGNVYGDNGTRYPNGNYPNSGSRAARIDQVNREYDAKIYSVRMNRNLSSAEKDRIIRQLEADRQRAIRRINNEYDGQNNRRYEDRNRRDRDDDDDDNDGRKYKGNNGKHLGWEKGVGNPHKSGNYNGNGKGKSKGKGKGKS